MEQPSLFQSEPLSSPASRKPRTDFLTGILVTWAEIWLGRKPGVHAREKLAKIADEAVSYAELAVALDREKAPNSGKSV